MPKRSPKALQDREAKRLKNRQQQRRQEAAERREEYAEAFVVQGAEPAIGGDFNGTFITMYRRLERIEADLIKHSKTIKEIRALYGGDKNRARRDINTLIELGAPIGEWSPEVGETSKRYRYRDGGAAVFPCNDVAYNKFCKRQR